MKPAWIAVLLLCAAWDPVTRKVREVEEGNRRYQAGEFSEAEKRYREAERRLPGAAGVHFDLGAALHRQAQEAPPGPQRDALFDAAEKELRLALDAGDAKLRASAHYNLGNTLYERGKFPEAIGEYKKSLRLDPAREDARHNLELALRMMKQPPPQPQPQPQPQDQQKPADQPQPQQTPPQPGDQQQPDEEKPQPQPGEDQQQEKEQPRASESEPRDLTDEDIERKLRELERRSKDLQVQRAAERSQERRRGKPAKDW
jgi:tetratricopeptide (TPR) repeat protein